MNIFFEHLVFWLISFFISLACLLVIQVVMNLLIAFVAWSPPYFMDPLNLLLARAIVVIALVLSTIAAWDGPEWEEKEALKEAELRRKYDHLA